MTVLSARAHVVLRDVIAAVVGDVDALAVRAHRHPIRIGAGGHGGRALGRKRPARADVVLRDIVSPAPDAVLVGDAACAEAAAARRTATVASAIHTRRLAPLQVGE